MVFVVEEINNNPNFTRNNDDLNSEIFISLKEALLGFKREIKHLDEHLVPVERNSVTQPGFVIKINGEGMPKHQRSEKGDLYVKVNVLMPNDLTEMQKESKKFFKIIYLVAKKLFEGRSYW